MLDFFYLVVDVASILLGLKKVLSLVLGYLSYMLQLYSEVSQDLHFKLNFLKYIKNLVCFKNQINCLKCMVGINKKPLLGCILKNSGMGHK